MRGIKFIVNQNKMLKDDDIETYRRLEVFYKNNGWDLWKYICFDKNEDDRHIGFYKNKEINDVYQRLINEMPENMRTSCFGGETDFNFCGKLRNQYFKYYLTEENSLMQLQKCQNMTYDDSCCNFSIMFSKGNLQGAKQKLGMDRFDVFLNMLDRYLTDDDQCILVAATAQNVKCLREYLKLFDSVYDYAHKVYLLKDNDEDNKLIRDLIDSGKKAIDSEKRIKEYMELAVRYWNARRENSCMKII